MKDVAVFFGGKSVEHDISVITGVLITNTLDKFKYNPIPIYIDHNGKWFTGDKLLDIEYYKNLKEKDLVEVTFVLGDSKLYKIKKGKKILPLHNISIAINCLHGERGEDGSLAGLLKMCSVPLASPSILPSAISMDKRVTKIFLKGLGINFLPSIITSGFVDYDKINEKLGYPVIVKPNKLGSSIGIQTANNSKELKQAVANALRFGDLAIIEKKLDNFIELNCSAYLNFANEIVVSECERPIGESEVLSFSDKYSCGSREFPAKIEPSISMQVKKITKKIYQELDFTGIVRIDFFFFNGKIFVNEINSVPGSLAYYLFKDTLKEFSNVLDEIIVVAERNFAREATFKKKFDSSLLNITGAKSSKRL